MTLSCSCSDDMDWWYYPPADYERLPTERGRRCCSCKAWIRPRDLCAKFVRERQPHSIVEERIYGDEVPQPPLWMCEGCADLFFNLDELGFCIQFDGTPMREKVREYARIFGRRSAVAELEERP